MSEAADFAQALDAVLTANYPKNSQAKFNAVSNLFAGLHETRPQDAAQLQRDMADPKHPLTKRLKAAFPIKDSRGKLISHLSGKAERATDTRGTPGGTVLVKPLSAIGDLVIYRHAGKALPALFPDWSRGNEHEHVDSFAVIEEKLRNQQTGYTPMDREAYKNSIVLNIPRDMALIKTSFDRALLKSLKAGTARPNEMLPEADVQRMLRARKEAIRVRRALGQPIVDLHIITPDLIRKAVHYQLGETFEIGKRDKSFKGEPDIDEVIRRLDESIEFLHGPEQDAMKARAKANEATQRLKKTTLDRAIPPSPKARAKGKGKARTAAPAKRIAPEAPRETAPKPAASEPASQPVKPATEPPPKLAPKGVPTKPAVPLDRATGKPMTQGHQAKTRAPPPPKPPGRVAKVAKAAIGEMIETIAAAGLAYSRSSAYKDHKWEKRHAIQNWRAEGHYVRLSAVFEVQNKMRNDPNRLDTSPLVAVSVEHTKDPLAKGWVGGIVPPREPDKAHRATAGRGRAPGQDAYFEYYPIEMLRPTGDLIEPNRLKLEGTYVATTLNGTGLFGTSDLRAPTQRLLLHPVMKQLADLSSDEFRLKDKSDIVDYRVQIQILDPKDIVVLYYNLFFGDQPAPLTHDFVGMRWSGHQPLNLQYCLSYRNFQGIYFLSRLTAYYDKDDVPFLIEERRYGLMQEVDWLGPWVFHYQHNSKTPQQVILWRKRDRIG